MAQDPNELVVGGHGDIYVAPSGTALPAENDVDGALNAAFVNLGYTTTDGVAFSNAPEIVDHSAWQSDDPVRRDRVRTARQFTFALEQWNKDNVPFALGGGTVVETAAGVFKYEFPDNDEPLDERAIVVDVQDGAKKWRWAFHRGNVTEPVESQFQRETLALLPITFKVLAPEGGGSPGFWLFEDVAFSSVS